MEKIKHLIFFFILSASLSCRHGSDCTLLMKKSLSELNAGNLTYALTIADSVRKLCPASNDLVQEADSVTEMASRIMKDFTVSEEQADMQIEKKSGPFSKEDKLKWEARGWLEYRILNGKKMYFKRAVSNLLLLKKFYEERDLNTKKPFDDPEMSLRLKNTSESYRMSQTRSGPVIPVKMAITYTITVHPDAVPEGETIRCWMPWPKSGHPRQKKVELLSASNQEYFISPDTSIHSTLYMEERAKKGIPTVFRISYRYESSAQYSDLSELKILPYNKESYTYKKYTSEQLPQINFSENLRHLADSITENEENPAAVVRKIYMWFKENIPWTGALEYSIMPDIPGYVLKNRRGDCGMQTFLYISMLRCKGIPVRWQSGWMVPPGSENLHDWCEVYFEGAGWVPSDISYDLQKTEIKKIREYFLSGIDSYRLIINDGVAGNLYPGKHFMRSEPYDFQRGEVEWKGGNLYFDKWDYDMNIDYLK